MSKAVRLLQGFLWLPKESRWRPEDELPPAIDVGARQAALLFDEVEAPFAFFDDGTPASSQRFYQLNAVVIVDDDAAGLKDWVLQLQKELDPLLQSSPAGVGWLLFEDLRDL